MHRQLNIYYNSRYRIRACAVLSSLYSRSLSGVLFKLMRLYVSPHYKRTGYNRDRRGREKDNSCIVRSISANISAMRVQFPRERGECYRHNASFCANRHAFRAHIPAQPHHTMHEQTYGVGRNENRSCRNSCDHRLRTVVQQHRHYITGSRDHSRSCARAD